MWQFPWRYRESVACVAGVVVVGLLLQWWVGGVDFYLLSSPVNLIVGGLVLLFLLLFSARRETPFYRWFSGIPLSVTLIGALLVMGIIMGLTPQVARLSLRDDSLLSRVGFRQVTSLWSFVLVYALTLLSLGALIVRRLMDFRVRDYAFYLNHVGVWILLFAAGLGHADMKRFVMHVQEGETEWRVYNDRQEVVELPVAIRLNDFVLEEYPPKLVVIDRRTGEVQPRGKAAYFLIDPQRPAGEVAGWKLTLLQYIHEAVRDSDTTYREVPMPGASPAALVRATDPKSGMSRSGWVCAGNTAQLYMTLPIDSNHCVAMTRPEPRRYVSHIDVFSEKGEEHYNIELEVNKPLRVGHWMIYQYGYDNIAGTMSTYSSMELVYDPWLFPAYLGMVFMALGAICLFWRGRGNEK